MNGGYGEWKAKKTVKKKVGESHNLPFPEGTRYIEEKKKKKNINNNKMHAVMIISWRYLNYSGLLTQGDYFRNKI